MLTVKFDQSVGDTNRAFRKGQVVNSNEAPDVWLRQQMRAGHATEVETEKAPADKVERKIPKYEKR